MEQSSVFIDTSGWAGPLIRNSQDFVRMEAYYKRLIGTQRPLVTTNYVLADLVALLTTRSRFTRPQVLTITSRIKLIRSLRIIHITPELDRAAWDMLEQYNDKSWSLVDASSFVLMREHHITEAFTTDHHFTQAGFVPVPG